MVDKQTIGNTNLQTKSNNYNTDKKHPTIGPMLLNSIIFI